MPAGLAEPIARVFLTADAVGGVWRYALDLAKGFEQRNIATVIAILGPSPSVDQRAELRRLPLVELIDSGLPLDWLAKSEAEQAEANAVIAELASGFRPDIIHLNSPALAAGQSYNAPVVAMAHSCVATWWRSVRRESMPEDFRWRTELTRCGLATADRVIAATHSFAAALREVYGRDLPIAVVPNGRDIAPGDIAPGDIAPGDIAPGDIAPRVSPKQRMVFAAGRLWDEGKNIALLDRIADRIDAPLIAAGPVSGPNGTSAEFPHLLLPGTLSETGIAPWYGRASVFAAPALYEPFGLAVLEAAHAGAALVLSDIPTFRELWGGAALFCAPDDEHGWTMALQTLLDTPAGAHELGAEAQRRASHYSTEDMIAGTLRVYETARARRSLSSYREAG